MNLSTRTARLALLLLAAVAPFGARAHDDAFGPVAPVDPAAEAVIHTAPGAAVAGEPRVAAGPETALLRLRVIDAATGEPAYCRVNVIGPDGNYYEPESHALAPWGLQRLGNRKEKGPFRYYGWYFYCDGDEAVRVPAGECTVEVWKGFEYRPVRQTVALAAGETKPITVAIERTLDMAAHGWYSGDTHIHLDRRDKTDEARALDLVAAEDIRYGFLLGMNDPKEFNGVMADQIWPQLEGMGQRAVVRRGPYSISSGYEYRNSTFGHIVLLMADDLVFKNQVLQVDEWPTFAEVARETHRLNGAAIHAHGGYEKEIYADYIPGATDGVELLQFAVYRGIGLEGWYHMLNAGFRFPAVGASDFPYCRALGDARTYVHIDGVPTMRAWTDAAVAGRSFITTGPMAQFSVNGAGPGEAVTLPEDATEVDVTLEIRSEIAPVTDIEFIANGTVVKHIPIDAESSHALPQHLAFREQLPVTGSTWFTVRAHGEQTPGLPDAEVHTNPVYVMRGEQPIKNAGSVQWLLGKLDGRIAIIEAMEDFEKKADVLQYFNDCRALLAAKGSGS